MSFLRVDFSPFKMRTIPAIKNSYWLDGFAGVYPFL